MNPIKLEQLLQLTATGRTSNAAVPLQADKSYTGVILTDPVQGARLLQLTTSQGILQLRLPKSIQTSNGTPMQASFQQLPDGRVQVQLQAKGEAMQSFPLNQQQALTLALNWGASSKVGAQGITTSTATQLPVELVTNSQQSQIRLPQGTLLHLPETLHRTIQSLITQFPQARLQASISLGTGQEPSLFIEVKPVSTAKVTNSGAAAQLSQVANTNLKENHSTTATPQRLQYQQLTLPTQLQQQLLQRLADSLQGQAVPARLQQQYLQMGALMLPLPQVRLPSGSYQISLQQEMQHWQLHFQSKQQASHKVTVSTEAFNRPIQWQAPVGASTSAQPSTTNLAGNEPKTLLDQGWRALLPLLPDSPARLASLPELPQPLQQVLQQLRQQLPGGQQVLQTAQVQQQLQAVLQFNPLQMPSQLAGSAAGTLAIAIQLLLGRLSQQPPAANQSPLAQRLIPLLQQLDAQSASQLLRQLASHSGAMQQSQLASAELQQQQPSQFLLQLPIQLEQQSSQLQVKIEQREESAESAGENSAKIWQLTMHFDLLELGKLMAKARLQENRLNLQIYSEQIKAQTLAEQFLPLLTERLTAQGIEVEQAQCQLGVVPGTLFTRQSSLIKVQA
ncbi:flagellar hook-length control protein FliK [Alkalimonas amylolytica]|uniref:Hook-length control protein FliK n=1 Tax=Alkalimonas amylolytica TaxID=152573 RepID=A0A1H4BLL2_ALKAM|nr:flagellar hook-length control protein FliK [Alkalimonas amylolytica]SEA48928.1 hook-length control protein FliK [Alkalimonas amylolytica]